MCAGVIKMILRCYYPSVESVTRTITIRNVWFTGIRSYLPNHNEKEIDFVTFIN
jgi:hypothetical protein